MLVPPPPGPLVRLADHIRLGLGAVTPRRLPAWLVDDPHGLELYGQLGGLPRWYYSRREQAVAVATAASLTHLGIATMVEVGLRGHATAELLAHQLGRTGRLHQRVLVDRCEQAVGAWAVRTADQWPGLAVTGQVTDGELSALAGGGPRLLTVLGGLYGTWPQPVRHQVLRLWTAEAATAAILLSVDLAKPPGRLLEAWTDTWPALVEWHRQPLVRLNRELAATFVPARWQPAVTLDPASSTIRFAVRSRARQTVRLAGIRPQTFHRGERLETGTWHALSESQVRNELAMAGLDCAAWQTDRAGDVAIAIAIPTRRRAAARPGGR